MTKVNLLLLLPLILPLLLILILILLYNNFSEKFENNIEIVIARYNESLDWLNDTKYSHNLKITIYNKGINDNFYKPPFSKILKIPNVGVCDHTYLYHIIKNYDNLANTTIFLPGSCMDENKKQKTENVINKTIKTNNTVIYCSNVEDQDYDFEILNHTLNNDTNRELNNDTTLRRCDIHPFGKWCEKVFPNIKIKCLTFHGIFSVSKKHIRNRSKKSYEELINYVNKDKNEECAHYIERTWIYIFNPLSTKFINL